MKKTAGKESPKETAAKAPAGKPTSGKAPAPAPEQAKPAPAPVKSASAKPAAGASAAEPDEAAPAAPKARMNKTELKFFEGLLNEKKETLLQELGYLEDNT